MRKILKLRKTPAELAVEKDVLSTRVRTCHRCLSEISFSVEDDLSHDDMAMGNNFYVVCPNCGYHITYDYRDDDE